MAKNIIKVNNNKLQDAINNSKDTINKIVDFFGINKVNINIRVLNYADFKHEFKKYLGYDINKDTTGFIEDDKNEVIILDYDDFKYTNHCNETYKEYVKVAIHEFVHVIHSIACHQNYPETKLWEGIAVFLSEQYDFNNNNGSGSYYEYGLYIYNFLKTHSKEELLILLNVE